MAHRKILTRLTALFATAAAAGIGAEAQAAEARLRVVDVGNAMCVIASVPGGHFMLYDAGNYGTEQCEAAVREIVGTDRLDLVVLSHSDEDHVGELAEILATTQADSIVYTGKQGTSGRTWPGVVSALGTAERRRPGTVRDLRTNPLPNTLTPQRPPLVVRLGAATVTFVAGWHNWTLPGDRGASQNASELRNVVSIVVRFEYGGHSVLLTGDTIGRRGGRTEPEAACRDAQRWMVRQGNVPLDSDILIGEHHGGNNSSALCFIEAVSPQYVIFPAGNSSHDHPRTTAVDRYFSASLPARVRVPRANIYRTDRGDDDGPNEWSEGRETRCVDPRGDDDVEIILSDRPGTPPRVQYRQPRRPCP